MIVASNLPTEDAFPENPGEWQIRSYNDGADSGLRIVFACPNQPGQTCGVPLAPMKLPNGASWTWDGDKAKPTLTPSINCVGGCGWHGWVKKGVIR